jgi:hypothetical protein
MSKTPAGRVSESPRHAGGECPRKLDRFVQQRYSELDEVSVRILGLLPHVPPCDASI